MHIEKAGVVTDDLFRVVERLVPQLGAHKIPPTREELQRLIHYEGCTLLVARIPDKDGEIAGILSLAIYLVPTGIRSIVEDIVVDQKFRRQGIAEAMLRAAIQLAQDAGAGNVSLSANPSRKEANQLYQKLGFVKRETNSYLLVLGK